MCSLLQPYRFVMSTKERFNELLCEFMEDLSSTFDEHQCLEVAVHSLKKMLGENKSTPLPMCVFQSAMERFDPAAVRTRDPVLLETLDSIVTSIGLKIDVKADYASTDDTTKDAIWEYIESLHTMASTFSDEGDLATVDMTSIETILASTSSMNPEHAEEMMSSIMCLVPPALKEFVDDRVHEFQQKIDTGELSTEEVMDQVKASMCQLT